MEAASPPWFFRYGGYISPESASSQLPGNRASFLIGPYHLIFSAPIKFLSSHHIAIWSIHERCSFRRSCTSQCWICNLINICWVAVKLCCKWCLNCGFSTVAQWISIGLQIRDWKEKEHLKLHLSCIDHIVIRWELKNSIGAKELEAEPL